jgi:hypothetical protein
MAPSSIEFLNIDKQSYRASRYGQRRQIEIVNSMIKRLTGEVVNARTYWRRCQLLLKTPTHNIRHPVATVRFSTEQDILAL